MLSSLSFYVALAGVVATLLITWLKETKRLPEKYRQFVYVPIVLSLLVLIVNRIVTNEASNKTNSKIDSLNGQILVLKGSNSALRQHQDSTANRFNKTLGESQDQIATLKDSVAILNQKLQPLPLPERLRRMLTQIDPRILTALQNGTYVFKVDMRTDEYDKLLDISKEPGTDEYMTVKPPAGTAMTNTGILISQGVTLILNRQLLGK